MSKLALAAPLLSTLVALSNLTADHSAFKPKEIQLNTAQVEKKVPRKSPIVKEAFSPFTGRLSGNGVRLRLQPDLDGAILAQLEKDMLVTIVSEEGDYYCVAAPENFKAYIFRSFVLDGVVEGNRVNVRLHPDLESPVIGHMSTGDRVEGTISSQNRKWLEISPPSSTRLYIAKNYVEYAGGPEYKAEMKQKEVSGVQILKEAHLLVSTEMDKPFEEVDFNAVKQGFLTIIHDYTDFPKLVDQAKNNLAKVQEDYLQKRISYLEEKAALAMNHTQGSSENKGVQMTQLLQMWEPIEEGLYASWSQGKNDKNKDEFYEEQLASAVSITGVVEAFKSAVNHRPGDFIIKDGKRPIAYVYSTKVDLKEYLGQTVTLISSPRSSRNFAFPAYFVHDVE